MRVNALFAERIMMARRALSNGFRFSMRELPRPTFRRILCGLTAASLNLTTRRPRGDHCNLGRYPGNVAKLGAIAWPAVSMAM
jgi:hypothetical protein